MSSRDSLLQKILQFIADQITELKLLPIHLKDCFSIFCHIIPERDSCLNCL